MMQSIRINESRVRQPRVRLPFALRHVRASMTGLRIPHIDIVGRDIEITADNGWCLRRDGLIDPTGQFVEPEKLRFIKR